MLDFKPDPKETKIFRDDQHVIVVHVENSRNQFAWQLEVDGDKSEPTTHYSGVLTHKGYGLATAYWDGVFPEFIPFAILPVAK
jgi:hypothetical protein